VKFSNNSKEIEPKQEKIEKSNKSMFTSEKLKQFKSHLTPKILTSGDFFKDHEYKEA
jgi:hypothetical protein